MTKSELTTADVSVVASLLGYNNVFIPRTASVYERSEALTEFVKNRVRSLERKHILRYELDGTLYIDEKIRKSVEAMCSPDRVLVLNSNCFKGKCAEMYIFIKDGFTLCATKKNRDRVALSMVTPKEIADFLPLDSDSEKMHSITEKILYEDTERIQQKLHSFQRDKAEEYLSALGVRAENTPVLCEILTGSCKYIRVRQLHRARGAYNVSGDEFYALVSGEPVSVNIDEFGVVNFESVSNDSLKNYVSEKLENV